MGRSLRLLVVAAVVFACWDQTLTDPPPGLQGSISDGAHQDPTANVDFFFLPPIVPDPALHENFDEGQFNDNLGPAVQICEGTGDLFGELCDLTTQVALFTMTSGPGSETVRAVPLDEHYIVNWHTDEFTLTTDVIYRVRVFVGVFLDSDGKRKGKELGFADVKMVTGGAKNAVTNDDIVLRDGRTLAIKFRAENNVLCVADDPAFDPTSPCNSKTVDLSDGVEDQVELRDNATGDQIGVLSIPPGQALEEGATGEITFTLQLCDQLDADIPQFGDCVRITADPPLTEVVGADGLDPFATISLCRIELLPPQNDLISVHRQDEETGEVFALPHADDDCEDVPIGAGPAPAPQWDVGQKPAGDSPYTSLFRNALPAKMDYVTAEDATRTTTPGAQLTTQVLVTDALGQPVEGARVTFAFPEGSDGTLAAGADVTGADGIAQVVWTVASGANTVEASGKGIATPDNNGPAEGFDPFWPGLHQEGVQQSPVLLGTGTLGFTAVASGQGTVDLSAGGSVDLRDENGDQIGVLTIPAQSLPEGSNVTFTLELCEALDADIPQFGDCLRITADPPLTQVAGEDGLDPPATISLCRLEFLPEQNELITVHRQDETTGEVFALPHADDDCEEPVILGPERGPQWDVGQKPAGDSPYTSLFRNALPVQMDPLAGTGGQTALPGATVAVPPGVLVTDRNGTAVAGATVHFAVLAGNGSITPFEVVSDATGTAQLASWQLGTAGENGVRAFGKGVAGPGQEPFMPDLPTEPGPQEPVLLGTGETFFTATATAPAGGTIFRATFTDDPLNAEPGAPEIGAWTVVDQSAGTIRVRSTVGDLTSKPVELNQAADLTGGVDLAGTVAGTPPTAGRWVVRWRSVINSTDASFAPVVLRGSGGGIIASLEYRSGGLLTYNSATNNIGIGWVTGKSQLFEIVVDLDDKVTDLWVDGAPVAGQQDVQFVGGASVTSLDRVGAELGGTSAQIFAWDDIEIVPAEVAIDGVLSAGEWDGATVYEPFPVNLPDGGTTTATLRMDNNDNNLFTSLQFAQDMSSFNLVILALRMDEDQNGAWDLGEDGYVVQQRDDGLKEDSFHDEFFSCNVSPCQGQPDVSWGGTNDGGTASTESPVTTIEAAHPLNSVDSRDAALTAGQTLKFFIIVNIGPADGAVTSTFFPGPNSTVFAVYTVK